MTLKQLRLESGLKAYKIAELLNISRVQLNNIENGKYNIDEYKIEKFSQIYDKSKIEIIKAINEVQNDKRRT